jgi:cysteine synthase
VTFHADPALGFPGMYEKVEQLKKELPNVHVLDQTKNQTNPEAHMRWTGMVTRSV